MEVASAFDFLTAAGAGGPVAWHQFVIPIHARLCSGPERLPLSFDEHKAQRHRWWAAAEALQTAVTAYASREDVDMSRYEVERAVKATVRHEEQDPAK